MNGEWKNLDNKYLRHLKRNEDWGPEQDAKPPASKFAAPKPQITLHPCCQLLQ